MQALILFRCKPKEILIAISMHPHQACSYSLRASYVLDNRCAICVVGISKPYAILPQACIVTRALKYYHKEMAIWMHLAVGRHGRRG